MGEQESEMEKESLENGTSWEAECRHKRKGSGRQDSRGEADSETKRSKRSRNSLFSCDCDKHREYNTIKKQTSEQLSLWEIGAVCLIFTLGLD